ncbi:hypothetical protein [Staphylococcus nepalensis]|nr:hypothetical protein [Staphylococcus nepalensis]
MNLKQALKIALLTVILAEEIKSVKGYKQAIIPAKNIGENYNLV